MLNKKRILHPLETQACGQQTQWAFLHSADNEVRVLVRLVGVAVVGKVFDAVGGIGNRNDRSHQVPAQIVDPFMTVILPVDVAVGRLMQRRIGHIGQRCHQEISTPGRQGAAGKQRECGNKCGYHGQGQ